MIDHVPLGLGVCSAKWHILHRKVGAVSCSGKSLTPTATRDTAPMSVKDMISISRFELSRNGDKSHIFSKEESTCPICGGSLKVHGTCTRKVRHGDHTYQYHLRVLKCCCCGKTHRELPAGIVPYKRYGLDSLCEIAEATETQHTCETSTWLRIRFWLAWFLWYAQNIMDGLIAAGHLPAAFHPGRSLRQRTASFVRLVANSGNWVQHRSAMTRGIRLDILVSL